MDPDPELDPDPDLDPDSDLDPDPLVSGRYGSGDPDQDSHQHVTDAQHCFVLLLRICFQDPELSKFQIRIRIL